MTATNSSSIPPSNDSIRYSTGRRNGESGVILLMVVLVLAGIFILALPLAFLSRSAERSNEQLLDRSTARRYAELALEHARNRLRLGIRDNEFHYLYPTPTASPTPTPTEIAERAPYDTPEYDGMAELYFDRKQEWNYLMGSDILQRPDGIIVDVEVEDEQGKLNINSLTPGLLLGLYLAVTGIDIASLSDTERANLDDLYDNCLTPLAQLRFKADMYVPLQSFDEFRNSEPGRLLSDSEMELLRPHLTVYSWRPSDTGFPRSYARSNYSSCKDRGYVSAGFPSDEPFVGLTPQFHLVALDANKVALAEYYLQPELLDTRYVIYLPDNIPDETFYISYGAEDFHCVNINTCSREVLMAFLLAETNLDEPHCTLDGALDAATLLMPQGWIDSMEDNGDTWALHLSPNSDIDHFPLGGYLSIAGRYAPIARNGDIITVSEEDGEDLATFFTLPFPVRRLLPNNSAITSGNPAFPEFIMVRITIIASSTSSRQQLCYASHDIYTITCRASVNSLFGMENGSYAIKEVVELGKGKRTDEAITLIDDYFDFNCLYYFRGNELNCRRLDNWLYLSLDRSGAMPIVESYPSVIGLAQRHVFYPPAGVYFSKSRSMSWNGTFFNSVSTLNGNDSFSIEGLVTEINTSILFLKRNEDLNITKMSAVPVYSPSSGGIAFSAWIRAWEWEPSAETNKRYIYTIRPATSDNGVGKVELYTENGNLILSATDDNGGWGRLSYKLTTDNMPKNTWMYIGFQIAGNQKAQMALFVDHRLVEAEYESSHTRGYCHELLGDFALSVPTLTVELAEDGLSANVASTEGFPSSGYLRIEDEILYYGSKTDTGFLGLRRGVAGTDADSHAASTEIRAAIAIKTDPVPEDIPHKDDTVSLYSYTELGKTDAPTSAGLTVPYYGRDALSVTFTLDSDAGYDSTTSKWIISPSSSGYNLSLISSNTSLNGSTNRLFALAGVSGMLPTGNYETGKISVIAMAPSSHEEAFYGNYAEITVIRPLSAARRLQTALTKDTDTLASVEVLGTAHELSGLLMVEDELILFRLADSTLHLERGKLGTTAAEHSSGVWAMPIYLYSTMVMKPALSSTAIEAEFDDTSYISMQGKFIQLDNEILYYSRKDSATSDPPYRIELLRGCYGTAPTSHEENSVALAFPTMCRYAYDLTGKTDIQSDYIEYIRRKAGSRYRALTWSNLADSDKIRMHWWIAMDNSGNFTYDANAPSGTPQHNVFHFDTSSTDFTISRDGKPVVSDYVVIRMVPEYLPGSWVPGDPTVHDWKVVPILDKIEIWCEDPDVVFLHEEGY